MILKSQRVGNNKDGSDGTLVSSNLFVDCLDYYKLQSYDISFLG